MEAYSDPGLIIYPMQSWGLGDILYEQTAIRTFANGRKIQWGVEPQFLFGLQNAFPDIDWILSRDSGIDYNRKDMHINNGRLVLPMRWTDSLMGVKYSDCMKSKYLYLNQDWQNWKQYAQFDRDIDRERKLALFLGVRLDKPYTLVNKFFGSNSQFKANIQVNGVEMKTVTGYSLFDYATLLENAEYLHLSNSSTLYLLELLDLKAKEIHLYTRHPLEKDFSNTQYIHTKPYILHY